MKILSLLIAVCLLGPGPDGNGGDKKKNKGKDQYYKYETENVQIYRDQRHFDLPAPPEPEVIEVQEEDPVSTSLEPFFSTGNKVYIDADYRLNQLVALDSMTNWKIDKLPGFRIQIYAGAGRQGAMKTKSSLMRHYPGVPNYLTFRSPNYVVRVGDFTDKEEAILFCRKLRENFPGAFVAPDKVNISRYLEGLDRN